MPIVSMASRLEEVFRRLRRQGPFRSFEEAYGGLVRVVNEVEDELSGSPYNPENWRADGRMYPPQRDNWFAVPDSPGVTRMRTRGHNIFIGANGAIEIRTVVDRVLVFRLRGADGKEVGIHG
jgi:hypothetical protein